MEENRVIKKKGKVGRNTKSDPAIYRYSISFNAKENAKLLSIFEQSRMSVKAHFITSCLFNKPIKVVKVDKALHDYYMRLTTFFGQYRMIGANYNQVVKGLKSNFKEEIALRMLYNLEQETIKLVETHKKIIELAEEFDEKFVKDEEVVLR